jgi:hypothetical protein
MRIGHRIVEPGEVGKWEGAEIYQISLYRGRGDNLGRLARCARAASAEGTPYVVHPVQYSLLEPACLDELREMARLSGDALILHDERAPDGGRLRGREAEEFRAAVRELSKLAHLSFENATDSGDAPWFWEEFARSVTLDMGHMESAGLDSAAFVRALPEDILRRVRYVHMHRNGSLHGGLTDHWPLRADCREVRALRELLKRRRDVDVLLEINEREETAESLRILGAVRASFPDA